MIGAAPTISRAARASAMATTLAIASCNALLGLGGDPTAEADPGSTGATSTASAVTATATGGIL